MPFLGSQPAETALTGGQISDDVIGINHLADGTDGQLITWGTDTEATTVAVGTAGHFLKSQGAGSVPVFAAGGQVVQVVNVMDSAVTTATTVHILDDTIPQNTEGVEFMTLAITPTHASNLLKIDVVVGSVSDSGADPHFIAALYQDSTANALAAVVNYNGSGSLRCCNMMFVHYMTAGTTSSTTFKVRAAGHNAGTMTLNGRVGARLFGGVMASSITITEILA